MDYSVGDTIVYRVFGGGERVTRVTEREEDVKNGRPGFSGVVAAGPDKGMRVWGYDEQITTVNRQH